MCTHQANKESNKKKEDYCTAAGGPGPRPRGGHEPSHMYIRYKTTRQHNARHGFLNRSQSILSLSLFSSFDF